MKKILIFSALLTVFCASKASAEITFGFYYTHQNDRLIANFGRLETLKGSLQKYVSRLETLFNKQIRISFIEKFPLNILKYDGYRKRYGIEVENFFQNTLKSFKPRNGADFIFILAEEIWDLYQNDEYGIFYRTQAGNSGPAENTRIALLAHINLEHPGAFEETLMHEWGHLIGLSDISEGCNAIQFIMCGWIKDGAPVVIEKSFQAAIKALH